MADKSVVVQAPECGRSAAHERRDADRLSSSSSSSPSPSASPSSSSFGRLAFFDLDGTITRKNVFIEFIRYAMGPRRFWRGLGELSPQIGLHYAKVVSKRRIKEIFVDYFFRGDEIEDMRRLARAYARRKMPGIVRPKALERIRWHRDQGDRIVVVSACIQTWIEDWCQTQGLELIATELEIRNGRVTGKLASDNCYGAEKVRRIRKAMDLDRRYIFAYGDSRGDREMLAMAHERFYRPFE